MDAGSLSAELRAIERTRLRSLVHFDVQVADRLHDDAFQLINPAGISLSKTDYLGGLSSGALRYEVFEPISEIAVRTHGESAVLRYQSRIQIVVEDQSLPLASYWHTDLYERHNGEWRVVWSQATRIAE